METDVTIVYHKLIEQSVKLYTSNNESSKKSLQQQNHSYYSNNNVRMISLF